MIDIKLAQYNSAGEFERFLEIGKDFVYGGYYILITEKMTLLGVLGCGDAFSFGRDEKDPLNRFDGLFDGFTYGNGRFVLIDKKHKFDIYETRYVVDIRHYTFRKIRHCVSSEIIGNLHQNPELYEKVKETSRWGLFDESRVRWKDVL